MTLVSERRPSHDDLIINYVFVPDGAPPPVAWLADHPGSFSIPAWFVSTGGGRSAAARLPESRRGAPPAPFLGPPAAPNIPDEPPSRVVPSLVSYAPATATAASGAVISDGVISDDMISGDVLDLLRKVLSNSL